MSSGETLTICNVIIIDIAAAACIMITKLNELLRIYKMILTENQKKTLAAANRILDKMAAYSADVSFTSASFGKDFFRGRLSTLEAEQFHVAYLNNQNQLIEADVAFKGTINSAPVFPRELAKRALELNATAVILSHNHPSGLTEPSRADRDITDMICECMSLFDIRVLDHIIVAKGNTYSFAEHGLV